MTEIEKKDDLFLLIEVFMAKHNLTNAQFAAKIGITREHFHKIKKKQCNPRPVLVRRMWMYINGEEIL